MSTVLIRAILIRNYERGVLPNFQIKFTEGFSHFLRVSPFSTGWASLTLRVEWAE